jgi:hypothetical protein
MVSTTPAFQPTLATPQSSWTIAINYVGGGLSGPAAIAADATGNLCLPNKTNNSVTKLDPTGEPAP